MNPTQTARYKTFWARFWAGWVDPLIFWPLSLLAPWIAPSSSPTWWIVAWLVFDNFCLVIYSILMHGWRGQTVGKMIFKIRVLDVSEQPLSMRQAVLRDSPNLVFSLLIVIYMLLNLDLYMRLIHSAPAWVSLPGWYSVLSHLSLAWTIAELISMQTNAKRRAIHDWIAGSVVVNERAIKHPTPELHD